MRKGFTGERPAGAAQLEVVSLTSISQSRGKNPTQAAFTSSFTPLARDQDSPALAGFVARIKRVLWPDKEQRVHAQKVQQTER